MLRSFTSGLLLAACVGVSSIHAAHAQSLDWLERFALAQERSGVLKELIPAVKSITCGTVSIIKSLGNLKLPKRYWLNGKPMNRFETPSISNKSKIVSDCSPIAPHPNEPSTTFVTDWASNSITPHPLLQAKSAIHRCSITRNSIPSS